MLYNFKLDDLIPLLAIGAILIIAIYHSILYFFSRLNLLGSYTLYLWLALTYMLLAVTTVPEKTFTSPSLPYLISSTVFLFSLLLYLEFLLIVLNLSKEKQNKFYRIIKKTYLITPLYCILRFPSFFVPEAWIEIVKLSGFVMDTYLFVVFGYVLYLIITNKKNTYNMYVVIGSGLMMFFSFFTSISYYTQGFIWNLSHVSFIALGYFSDAIFFSLVVGLQMRQNIKERYEAINQGNKEKLALEIEKKKASDILLTQDFKLETEKTKAIIEQRTEIGRKLHDDLSGSLVALRYLIEDKLRKAKTENELEAFKEIDDEIKTIYSETRDYSHFLSGKHLVLDNNHYDIDEYLEAMKLRFEKLNFFAIKTVYSKTELRRHFTPTISEQIYYLLKECLSNIIKHAKATEISIVISFLNDKLEVEIKDNGKGFGVNNDQDGIGIKNLRSRLSMINGELNIMSNSSGTIVSAIAPLRMMNTIN